MPHIVIEHSYNALLTKPAEELLQTLHKALAALPSFQLSDIKSRVIPHQQYCIADGTPQNGFVHVRLEIMTGREETLRQQAAQVLLAIIGKAFRASDNDGRVLCSIEVREMQRETYFKQII